MSHWISVTDKLPDPGVRVLMLKKDDRGKWRTALGSWTKTRTEECDTDGCSQDCERCSFGDWDEDKEMAWKAEGFYEEPLESEYYYPIDGILYWQPRPAMPDETEEG